MAASILLKQINKTELSSSNFLEFLHDAQDACLIQISTSELHALSPEDLSPAEWARFRALLTRLSRNNRVLICRDLDENCKRPSCDVPCDVEIQKATHSILGAAASPPGTEIASYPNSGLRALVRRYDLSLRGRPRKTDFENGVLSLAALAVNEITFVDRQLGKFWNNPSYRNTLSWIISFARIRGVARFNLVTSATTFEEDIHDWCAINGIRLDNRDARQLPHERAMITKRFSISIDRGFDLLTLKGALRSCGIYIQQAGAEFSAEYAAAAKLSPNYECLHCHR